MPKYVKLPDNSLFPVEEGEDYSAAMRAAYAKYPDAFGAPAAPEQKKSGIAGAFGRGLENLFSSGQTAVGAITGSPEEAAAAAAKRQEAIDQKYAEQVSLERVKSAYNKDGILAAGKEALSQIPAAIAEQAPNLAEMAGGARLGAMAGSLAGPVGTIVGGAAGALAPSLLHQFGGNIERQAQEQTNAGQPVSINTGAAALAAAPQAALDVASNFIPFGGKLVSKLTGIPEKAFFSKSAEAAEKVANERLMTTLAKGTATGVLAEVPTEIAQQMLERAQAGLSLTDQDAMAEYGKTAYQVGLLGPLGAVGRLSEKSGARADIEDRKNAEAEAARAKAQADAAAAEAEANKPKLLEYTPETAPEQTPPAPQPPINVARLMEEHDTLQRQQEDLYTKMSSSPEAFRELEPLHTQLEQRTKNLANLIEQNGGTTETPERFDAQATSALSALDKKIEAANKAFATAMDPNNRKIEEGKKAVAQLDKLTAERNTLAQDLETRRTSLSEKIAGLQQRGQTRDMFAEAPAPAPTAQNEAEKSVVQEAEQDRALYGPDAKRASAMQAFSMAGIGPQGQIEAAPEQRTLTLPGLRLNQLKQSEVKYDEANRKLAEAVKTKDQVLIDSALKDVNKYEAQSSRLSEPFVKGNPIDIFDTSNILKNAIDRNDWATVMEHTKAREEVDKQSLEQKAKERQELDRVLSDRLGMGGNAPATTKTGEKGEPLRSVERVQKPIEEIAREHPEFGDKYRLLRSGTYPNSVETTNVDARRRAEEEQLRYDQSPDAYAYDIVMGKIENLKKKVERKQGNAKRSWLQELTDIAEEHATVQQQLETGIAKPTMREKVAGVQATLGKGQAPAQRQMDAAEKAQAAKRMEKLEEEYHRVLNKITPVKNEIVKMYSSLYNTRPLQTVKEEQKAKADLSAAPAKEAASRLVAASEKLKTAKAFNDTEAVAEAEKEIKRLSTMSREAKRAKRINEGDVRYEAGKSEKMDALAYGLGTQTDAFDAALNGAGQRLEKLVARYGNEDSSVKEFKQLTKELLTEVAIREGKKTPEFRTAMKEQVQMMRTALGSAPQEVQSRRDKTPVSRTVSVARKEKPSSVPVADKEPGKATTTKGKAAAKKVNAQDGGTAYRMRETEGTVIDAKEAADFMDNVQKNLPENVKLVYAPTPGQIPVRVLKMMAAEGVDPTEAMVQGAVFSDGTVLVVGDQHVDLRDLEETVAHELVGHYGIDTIIGTKRLQEYANKTDLAKLAEDIGGEQLLREMQRVGANNLAMGRSEELQKLQVLREIIAHTEEARVTESFREKAGRWMKELVGMVRAGLRDMGFTKLTGLSNSDVFYMLRQSRKEFNNKTIGPYRAADGQIAFRTKREPSSSIFAREPSVVDTFLGNVLGLAGRVQYVDKHAALSEAFKRGQAAGKITSQEALNAEWGLRFGEQRSMYAGQFMTNGRVHLVTEKTPDGTSFVYESKKGVNMLDMAKALNEGGFENDTKAENVLTIYEAGARANQVGWEKLNFENAAAAKAEYQGVMAELNANPKQKAAVEKASKLYREYNAGLLDFLVETGALTKEKAAELKSISYVPFYRVAGSGDVQLMVDKEHIVRIGNIKDEPQLQALVGDNKHIMPIFTSAVQNTFMLTDMGLRNQAVKESAFALHKIGIASRIADGKGPANPDTVRFKVKGKDVYATIDTDMYGIPASLIVKGMEGIKTTLPAVVKLMGIPADILRKFVTRNPVYAVRQVVRDPLNAWLTTGTDATPVLSSMKELAGMVAGRSKVERELMEAGAISSNVFSGDQRDMAKFLRDVTAGKSGWEKVMAKLDAFALQGDAATRAVVYKDSLDKGMTKQQALLRTLESMNFSRRGLSPSMQALSVMIPFFNAQIQGLDVLYRAYTGNMPFSEQLQIKQKMIARGLMLAAGTMAYAALMSDDEAYKRAKPEERYANWFVYVPGLDEPVRVPIPFELGYLFKALPEAVYNMAVNDEKASKALGGMYKLLEQSNPFSLPQAIKPLTEAVLGKSFYGGDIESQREQNLLATDRYRETTTELSKLLGKATGEVGVSPITLDYLIRGYTGPLGIALVSLANPILNTEVKADVAEPTLKLSKTPFIGGLFQPVEGRGTLDEAYDLMKKVQQTKGTYNDMVEKGNRAEAGRFVQENTNMLALASTSGAVQKYLGDLAKQERMVRASPNLTTEQKDERLARLDKIKTEYARKFIALADRTTPR
jgi:hypothetical protein